MLTTTQGIVLHSLKYGETSLILNILTRDYGLHTYIYKGVRKSKTHAANLLFPLSCISLTSYMKASTGMHLLKEISASPSLPSILLSPQKNLQSLFLSEVILKSMKHEDTDQAMFDFLHDQIILLENTHENVSLFQLNLLAKLTLYLGFSPHGNYDQQHNPYFDLLEGYYSGHLPVHGQYLSGTDAALFSRVFAIDERLLPRLNITLAETKNALHLLTKYYQLHALHGQQLKSFDILLELL
ncbi:MAG: DNA repair protein RecO [Bacteroidetes bacterium]|nr:DNA repair protein RecO [Bacteroidota bacterium]